MLKIQHSTKMAAGKYAVWLASRHKEICLHLFPTEGYRFWGHKVKRWAYGPIHYYGFGRFFMIVWG